MDIICYVVIVFSVISACFSVALYLRCDALMSYIYYLRNSKVRFDTEIVELLKGKISRKNPDLTPDEPDVSILKTKSGQSHEMIIDVIPELQFNTHDGKIYDLSIRRISCDVKTQSEYFLRKNSKFHKLNFPTDYIYILASHSGIPKPTLYVKAIGTERYIDTVVKKYFGF